jgi:hypothetical protein
VPDNTLEGRALLCSTNSDSTIGNIIAEAMKKVGKDVRNRSASRPALLVMNLEALVGSRNRVIAEVTLSPSRNRRPSISATICWIEFSDITPSPQLKGLIVRPPLTIATSSHGWKGSRLFSRLEARKPDTFRKKSLTSGSLDTLALRWFNNSPGAWNAKHTRFCGLFHIDGENRALGSLALW